jgi:DNA-binding MarR family transcriptional regulator
LTSLGFCAYSVHPVNDREAKEDKLTLDLLNAIDGHSDLSQRRLARTMGVALGLANSYLKRCVRKGLVKISDAPANRYLYYLTPKGFAEKARLTGQYLSTSLSFYRQSAESCSSAFAECAQRGWRRVLLCGVSELAEIALLRAMESEVDVVGIYDPGAESARFLGRPVWRNLQEVPPFDACVVTDLSDPLRAYKDAATQMGGSRVWVPDVLGLRSVVSNTHTRQVG